MRSGSAVDRARRSGLVTTTRSSLRRRSSMASSLGRLPFAPEILSSKNIAQPASASRDSWISSVCSLVETCDCPYAGDRRRRGSSCLQPRALVVRARPPDLRRRRDVERGQVPGPQRAWPGEPGCLRRLAMGLILGRGKPVAPTIRNLNPRLVLDRLRLSRNTQPRTKFAAPPRNRPLRIRLTEPAWQRQAGRSACPESSGGRGKRGPSHGSAAGTAETGAAELPTRQTASSRPAEKKSSVACILHAVDNLAVLAPD